MQNIIESDWKNSEIEFQSRIHTWALPSGAFDSSFRENCFQLLHLYFLSPLKSLPSFPQAFTGSSCSLFPDYSWQPLCLGVFLRTLKSMALTESQFRNLEGIIATFQWARQLNITTEYHNLMRGNFRIVGFFWRLGPKTYLFWSNSIILLWGKWGLQQGDNSPKLGKFQSLES